MLMINFTGINCEPLIKYRFVCFVHKQGRTFVTMLYFDLGLVRFYKATFQSVPTCIYASRMCKTGQLRPPRSGDPGPIILMKIRA